MFVMASQQKLWFTPICFVFVCVDALPPNQQFKSCMDEFLSSFITKELIKRFAQ